jgi:hypothetical protein
MRRRACLRGAPPPDAVAKAADEAKTARATGSVELQGRHHGSPEILMVLDQRGGKTSGNRVIKPAADGR